MRIFQKAPSDLCYLPKPLPTGMASEILLPNDLAGCQALIAEMAKTVAAQEQTITTLKQKSLEQQLRIAELLRLASEASAEPLSGRPGSTEAGLRRGSVRRGGRTGDAARRWAATQEIAARYGRRTSRPKKPCNEQLPAHLERRNVTAEVPEAMRFCPTHGERTIIDMTIKRRWSSSSPTSQAVGDPEVRLSRFCGVWHRRATSTVGLVEGNRYDTSVAAQIITT